MLRAAASPLARPCRPRVRRRARPRCSATPLGAVADLAHVLLVSENLRRRVGRPLVAEHDCERADAVVGAAACAVLLIGAPDGAGGAGAGGRQRLLYANAAGAALLRAAAAPAAAAEAPAAAPEAPAPPRVQLPDCLRDRPLDDGADAASSSGRGSGPPADGAGGGWRLERGASWAPLGAAGEAATAERLLACTVTAPNGERVGTALLLERWCWSGGCLGRPGFERVPPSELPDAARVQAAADAVRQQADATRELKQRHGLANADARVAAAVAELQRRKAALARLEALAAAFADGGGGGGGGELDRLLAPLPPAPSGGEEEAV